MTYLTEAGEEMRKVFYEKRGRRYFPVREYDSDVMDAMPAGAHLVCVFPGTRSTRYQVIPDHAAVLAAIRMHHEAMLKVIRDSSAMTITPRENTAKEKRAIKAFYDVMGKESLLTMSGASAQDVIHALEVGLLREIEKDKLNGDIKVTK